MPRAPRTQPLLLLPTLLLPALLLIGFVTGLIQNLVSDPAPGYSQSADAHVAP